MNGADKYKDLKQHLLNQSVQPFQGSYHTASLYFFKMLQNIHVDTIIAKADINELQDKIRFMQDRLKQVQVRTSSKKKISTPETQQKRNRNHQNGVGKQIRYLCRLNKCCQMFNRLSELRFHQNQKHKNQTPIRQQIFTIQIKNESEF